MIKFGFELEGFALVVGEGPVPPQKIDQGYPRDAFPGLLELRTSGPKNSFEEAYAEIIAKWLSLKRPENVSFDFSEPWYVFKSEHMSWMRKNCVFNKQPLDIQNIYGKKLKLIGNKTLASLQINFSNCIEEERVDYQTKVKYPARYGLLDIQKIVEGLDKIFKDEIKQAGRQPGMFAIKDSGIRLEYRSLPNRVFPFNLDNADIFISKIKNVIA